MFAAIKFDSDIGYGRGKIYFEAQDNPNFLKELCEQGAITTITFSIEYPNWNTELAEPDLIINLRTGEIIDP